VRVLSGARIEVVVEVRALLQLGDVAQQQYGQKLSTMTGYAV
jgi:hypothetical protein